MQPPRMRCITPIFHPCFNASTGDIAMDILLSKWSPALSVTVLLESVRSLMANGAVEDNDKSAIKNVNVEAANLWKSDRFKYNQTARAAAIKHAGASNHEPFTFLRAIPVRDQARVANVRCKPSIVNHITRTQLQGTYISIAVSAETTIEQLKMQLHGGAITMLRPVHQTLLLYGFPLDYDGWTLGDYGILEGDVISVTPKDGIQGVNQLPAIALNIQRDPALGYDIFGEMARLAAPIAASNAAYAQALAIAKTDDAQGVANLLRWTPPKKNTKELSTCKMQSRWMFSSLMQPKRR